MGVDVQQVRDQPGAREGSETIRVGAGAADGFRVIDSRALFAGEHEIGIVHAGETYRLRITRQGKLILNK
jgi:hemin uptake protein HemP